MRIFLSLIAAVLAVGAAAEPSSPEPRGVLPEPNSPLVADEGRVPCRDTIHQVREERALPRLQREPAAPGEPMLIAAVDHRIDGCSVLVMYNDTSDVRPLPALRDGPVQLERIPAAKVPAQ